MNNFCSFNLFSTTMKQGRDMYNVKSQQPQREAVLESVDNNIN